MVAISGNTYPVKDQLKQLGGKWDVEKKAWLIPDDKAEEAKRLVESQPKETASHGPKKQCWECGRMFTYAEAKRWGGDWKDSYCGC